LSPQAIDADTISRIAVRRLAPADIAAGAAVVGIRIQGSAWPVATGSAVDAIVNTSSEKTLAILVRKSFDAGLAARAAVVDIVVEVCADMAPARSTEPAGIAVARPTRRKAELLIPLKSAAAEGFARILPGG
jgi:hypothetical protein